MTAISMFIRKDVNIIENVTCSITDSVGDAVYFSGVNIVTKASALSISTARVVGFIEEKQSNTKCKLRIGGVLFKSGLSVGTYFLDIIPGKITLLPPTLSNSVVVKVGVAKSADTFVVEVSQNRVVRS